MRQFDGTSWNNAIKDTGWRDISSYADVVGTYDYDPEYDSYDYNINIAGAGVPTARQAEMTYQFTTRAMAGLLSYNVYEVEWITFDLWPTSLPGTSL